MQITFIAFFSTQVLEGEHKDGLIVFDRRDFYIEGVHIGEIKYSTCKRRSNLDDIYLV